MPFLRIDPHSATVRFFKEDTEQLPLHEMEIAENSKWYKVLTLLFSDTGDVRVVASENAPTIREIRLLHKKLKQLGYKSASWNHAGKEHTIVLTK
jgi:hypothetical protein